MIVIIAGASGVLFSDRVLPRVGVGVTPVGGLTAAQVRQTIEDQVSDLHRQGIELTIDGVSYPIAVESFGYWVDVDDAVDRAMGIGRSGTFSQRLRDIVGVLGGPVTIPPSVSFNRDAVISMIDSIALRVDYPLRDVRLVVSGGLVDIATDTEPGRILDRDALLRQISQSLVQIKQRGIIAATVVQEPVIDAASASAALSGARSMIERPLLLKSPAQEHSDTPIAPEQIAVWITSRSRDRQLLAGVDQDAVSQYVASLATTLDVDAREPKLVIEGKRVIEFTAPVAGRLLNQEKAIADIITVLESRRDGVGANGQTDAVTLDIQIAKPSGFSADVQASGIRELIGRAATTFVGSPPNRISNIKNGVKFLNGLLIAPGDEFSTIRALGRIDNTTGYLPELVIKQNRTVPEFGGGLCQVSTTLFRAVMNAGLPITARQNHSYRVSYYEKDGDGKRIGPGLDATIYNPSPDFRFRNDTGETILLHGFVQGSRVIFEFYGTKDGRTSRIDGPTTLSTSPPGAAIRTLTDTLPPGKVKQIERAHPGGSATATYTITYPDGRVAEQVFKSFYRPWPEQFLVGAEVPPPTEDATSNPIVEPAPVPVP